MSEILKKWDAICRDATIKFNANDTVVFDYAIVKIVDRGSDSHDYQALTNQGGSYTKFVNNFYIEYEEVLSETQYVGGGRGKVYFGKDQPHELIVGSKALVLFASYPQSENRSTITVVGVLHLKSGEIFKNLGGSFFGSHNLGFKTKITGTGSSILQIKKVSTKTGRYFKYSFGSLVLAVLLIGIFPNSKSGIVGAFFDIITISFCIFGLLSLWNFIKELRGDSDYLTSYFDKLHVVVMELFAKDAPAYWKELEAKQGG